MKYKGIIKINSEKLEQLEKLCVEPDSSVERDSTVFDEKYHFPNDKRMAVQICSTNSPSEYPCWTQGVLFSKNGHELGCTDVGESFAGEYIVFDEKDEYQVTVE
jgi:hypothetical protein